MSTPTIVYQIEPISVVINRRFGAFGVSWSAVQWLRRHGHPQARRARRRGVDSYLNTIDRRDPLLLDCIAQLGTAANGEGADLLVEQVNPTVRIYDRDGLETAAA